MAFTEALEFAVIEMEARVRADPERYEGWDWFQLTPAEAQVFGIDPKRWPRMMTAWSYFETVLGIVDPETHAIHPALVEEARGRWKFAETSLEGFTAFAVAEARLTRREAHAVFYKIDFWELRNGVAQFEDE